WVSQSARQAGVLPGFRYAAGLSLAPDLRADVVSPTEIKKEVAAITARLGRFTPDVEPSSEEPGVFWLSVAGLNLLHPSLKQWARSICTDLLALGYRATVVAGFTRFGTYAVAKGQQRTVVFEDPSEESAAARRVPLDCLDLPPELRDSLSKLGVRTVDALLRLPAGGLLERFGPEAYRLRQLASDELWMPLQPQRVEEPIQQRLGLDAPETDATRLLFLIKRLLDPLLAVLVSKGEALVELVLCLVLDRTEQHNERIRPAVPTLDAVQVLDLVRLRLEALGLSSGVVEIELAVLGSPAPREQLRFFAEKPRRDLDAANRALARLRAEFGDEAVVRVRLTDGHLPEARFTWEPLERIDLARPREVALRTLVRRILARPISLPPRPHHPDGWPVPELEPLGPYVVSGGWWMRETHREYHFAATRRGDLLWLYYDRDHQRWFLHGLVE
ncbi:MAG: DNA polymerase Y family protein, partial [Candidatus Methylomirabilia bacterium]